MYYEHCKFPTLSNLCHLLSTYGLPYFTAACLLFVLHCISQRAFMEKDRCDCPQLAAKELRLPEVRLIASRCWSNRLKVRTQVIPLPFQTLPQPYRRHSTLWNAPPPNQSDKLRQPCEIIPGSANIQIHGERWKLAAKTKTGGNFPGNMTVISHNYWAPRTEGPWPRD